MTESTAERAARIAERGVGSAIAAGRQVDLQIEIAEWHLRQVVEIGERLRAADQGRRSDGDDQLMELINSMVEPPVRNALVGVERAQHALDLLARRYADRDDR